MAGLHESRRAPCFHAIDSDGLLFWYKHNDYLTGGSGWAPRNQVGNGWHVFDDVFAAGEGLIYAREASGRTYCYRDTAWRTGAGHFEARVELVEVLPEAHAMFAALKGADFFRGPS